MSELVDALHASFYSLRSYYRVAKPIIAQHLLTLGWSFKLSLLELKEDCLRPFRRYPDHILLLDSPDAQGWQTCVHAIDDTVRAFRIQHLDVRKLSFGVRVQRRAKGLSQSTERGAARAGEPIMHLARIPRPPQATEQMILEQVRRVLDEDMLDDVEWILRDAVKGAKRRCLREGAGMEWCDVWLARITKSRPGAIVREEKSRVPESEVAKQLARFVP